VAECGLTPLPRTRDRMVTQRGTNIFTEKPIFTRGLLHIYVTLIQSGLIDLWFDPEDQFPSQ
jgi:hypothetical protein